jgi:site-specific DNA-cytosine methylase
VEAVEDLASLDLFSGLRGWSAPFAQHGHETFAIDIDRRFSADACLDIGEVTDVLETLPWLPDVIFASPPCHSFSIGSMGKMAPDRGEALQWRPQGPNACRAAGRPAASHGPRTCPPSFAP